MKRYRVELEADLADLVPGLLANRQRELQTLRTALQAQDMECIRKIGHNLKGVAGSYGLMDLSDLGLQLEKAARQDDTEGVANVLSGMEEYLTGLEVSYR